MKLIKLILQTKNNKRNGIYLYSPIVEINGRYFYCESIKANKVLKQDQINISTIKPTREIQPQYYQANGLVSTNSTKSD